MMESLHNKGFSIINNMILILFQTFSQIMTDVTNMGEVLAISSYWIHLQAWD